MPEIQPATAHPWQQGARAEIKTNKVQRKRDKTLNYGSGGHHKDNKSGARCSAKKLCVVKKTLPKKGTIALHA